MSAGYRLRAPKDARRAVACRRDAGFSLIEVVVAIAVINIVMASLATFYVRSMSINHHQGQRQGAAQVATAAMEQVRAAGGDTLLHNRDETSVQSQSQVSGVDKYLADTELAWDATAALGAGASAPLPTTAKKVTLSGVDYWQHWYVGTCWQTGSNTSCAAANKGAAPPLVEMLRVVVAVTWRDKECPASTCVFFTSTLVSEDSDPIWGGPAPAPAPTHGEDETATGLQQETVTKTVTTPNVPPKPDIYFLADTTGSMGGTLSNVRTNATQIIADVDAAASDARYGAGEYKDFQDPFAYRNNAAIPAGDDDGAAAKSGMNAWIANGGYDSPEAGLFALHKLIAAAQFRPDSSRIVVWFGDAPGHDPVCSAISGEAAVTEASVTAELVAAKIKVLAISTTTGPPDGLDDDPVSLSDSAYSACGIGGSRGQGSRIAAATGGTAFQDVPPTKVASTITAGLSNLSATVTPVATCDAGLTVTFDQPSRTVPSGNQATFTETFTVSDSVTSSTPLKCTVEFRVNGLLVSQAFVQVHTITPT